MRALLIGASGPIGQAVLSQLGQHSDIQAVDSVARHEHANQFGTVYVLNAHNEQSVRAFAQQQKDRGIYYQVIICTLGFLHDETHNVQPEKRLEDINAQSLQQYFQVNTILPALWLSVLPQLITRAVTKVAFFSARVGSISDNRLGGWYGYRASKAALNMLIKTAGVEFARRYKHLALMSYHPGTVDTGLSRPFQANVKADKLFSPAFTAERLVNHLLALEPHDSPAYLDWDGQQITW